MILCSFLFVGTYTYIFPLLIEYRITKLFNSFRTMMHWTIRTDFFFDIISQSELFATLVTSCKKMIKMIINIYWTKHKTGTIYSTRNVYYKFSALIASARTQPRYPKRNIFTFIYAKKLLQFIVQCFIILVFRIHF